MEVKVINKSRHNLPTYETAGSAGFDLRADIEESVTIHPMERVIIATGMFFEIPVGYEMRVQTRSGMAAKYAVIVCNTPGCVDSDYRGEVKVILINLGSSDFVVEPGDRIAQGIISAVARAEFVEVDSLSKTERGEGGFGHTGIK